MAKDKFLLVSLKDDQAQKLAQVISNPTCRKILDYLAEKDASESQISKDLTLPISTVHYNIQQLIKGNLVISDEFHYSKKGKEVSHYKLANKYIIIAPKSTYGIKEKLKTIFPIALVGVLTAWLINFFQNKPFISKQLAADTFETATEPFASEAIRGISAVAEAESITTQTIEKSTEAITAVEPSIALWFFIGIIFAIILYLIIDFIIYKTK